MAKGGGLQNWVMVPKLPRTVAMGKVPPAPKVLVPESAPQALASIQTAPFPIAPAPKPISLPLTLKAPPPKEAP